MRSSRPRLRAGARRARRPYARAAIRLDHAGGVALQRVVNSLKKRVRFSTSTPAPGEQVGQRDGVGVIDARQPLQADAAEQRQVDREGERAEAGVGADVRRRLLAADVLLARRQRQHEPRLPLASTVSPHRPGICRTNFRASRKQADIGPAEIQRIADRLALADDDIRAHLARLASQPSDTASVKTAISSAPLAWQASAIGVRSRKLPKTSGDCTTTQDVSLSIFDAMSSRPARRPAW